MNTFISQGVRNSEVLLYFKPSPEDQQTDDGEEETDNGHHTANMAHYA